MSKRSFISVLLVSLCIHTWSQTTPIVNIFFNDGSVEKLHVNDIDSMTFHLSDNDENTEMEVLKVWDNGMYCAFPSLLKYRDRYYCAFREGVSHVDDEGYIRILCSENGKDWVSKEVIRIKASDLRDPCLSIMPNGKMLLLCGLRSKVENERYKVRTYSSIFDDENDLFEELKPVNLKITSNHNYDCEWLWKLTWYEGRGYGFAYYNDGDNDCKISLFETEDGINYSKITDVSIDGNLTESRVQFTANGDMTALVRQDGVVNNGIIGYSTFPSITIIFPKIE